MDGSGGWDIAALELATGKEMILTNGTTPSIPRGTRTDVLFISGFVSADGKDVQSFGQGGCNWVEPSPDGTIVTCITDAGLALWPIAGGEPRLIPLDSTPTSVSWQRVAGD